MDMIPFDYRNYNKNSHSKALNQSICIPSIANSYAQVIEFARNWFLNKFEYGTFKTVYVDGKYIYDEQRTLSKTTLLKREKPAVAIVPQIDWGFNNDNVDMYQFGTDLYQRHGLYKNSFLKDLDHQVNLGLAMETLMVNFTFRIRLETRAQQMDMFKYIQLACRVGNTLGEDVDLDFHVPYELMIQIATDLGFEICSEKNSKYPKIKEVKKFLSYLNTHSSLPFLYKFRAINGKNEFFIRMQRMYVHVRPTDLSADDGEREGHLANNFGIEMSAEVRFPSPKFYAYYSSNEHKIKEIFTGFTQPNGIVTTFYTFKGTPIPKQNKLGWNLYLETTYEEDNIDALNKPLKIDFSDLLSEGDLGATIRDCADQGISPSIFCDLIFINGGEYMYGTMDWNHMIFTSKEPISSMGTFIGIYIDNTYINNYISADRDANKNRLQPTKDPKSIYHDI